jgi:hypothetical protein
MSLLIPRLPSRRIPHLSVPGDCRNYYKTGSLMANSCRAAVKLAGHPPALEQVAFAYGRHVGLAFQVRRGRGEEEELGMDGCMRMVMGSIRFPFG